MKKIFLLIIALYFLIGCASKQPIQTSSATILFKTPTMKYYDRGFIKKYDNHILLNIFNAGVSVLNLKIYKNEICQNTIQCLSSKEFNKRYLNSSYNDDFLYKLFSQQKVYFKDNTNKIFIKINK